MDRAGYIAAFRARAASQRERIDRARVEARAAAGRAVAVVVARFAPSRVTLIGSLPRGTFLPGSDLDLVVEGLAPDEVEEAERVASEAAGLSVDILRVEALDAGWRAHHERFGERVHERR